LLFIKDAARDPDPSMPTSLLKRFRKEVRPPFAVPEGMRVYAIGDIHGCIEQLDDLLEAIDKDATGCTLDTHLVFLGDLVDRGPQSADVVGLLRTGPLPADTAHFIMGNHEEVMIDCYDGANDRSAAWLQYGGVETLESYGLKRKDILAPSFEVRSAMRSAVPASHIRFLKSFHDSVCLGDYLFVHAGIRPGIRIDDQWSRDLRWIRQGFLDNRSDHGCMVVHGHSIVPATEFHSNRIAIDTGCYASGTLSALALEADTARVLSVNAR
jgi:serine/threonine protein phosphatase 1